MYFLPLVILKSESPFVPLLGRNWLSVLNKNWKELLLDNKIVIKQISETDIISQEFELSKVKNKLVAQIKSQFSNLFVDEPDSFIKGFKAEFKLKDGVNPIFHRAYEMPYSLKPKVEEELSQMVKSGVLCKVTLLY